MARRDPWRWLVGATLLLILAGLRWPAANWLQNDFSSLLPVTGNSHWQQRAIASNGANYERKLVMAATAITPGADPWDFIDAVRSDLNAAGYLSPKAEESDQNAWQDAFQHLHSYRRGLLSDADRQALQTQPEAYLANYRSYLFSPLGSSALNSLDDDPAGTFRHLVEAALPANAVPVSDEATEWAVLSLNPDALGLSRSEGLYRLYLGWHEAAAKQGLAFHASGAPLYAAFGTHSGRSEITTIGLISLSTLALLLGLSLRSWRALGLTLLCIGAGLVCGLLVTVIVLQEIHLLTLVFGATLIGIAADYALHYLAHSLSPGWRPERGLDTVLGSLRLGAASSALAFIALALLPFPGIRQIGIFMAAGLAGAYATVVLLFPALYPGPAHPPGLPGFCRRGSCQNTAGKLRGYGLIALALVLLLPGLFILQAGDNVRDFYAQPADLTSDEAALLALAGGSRQGDSRLLLVQAADPAALLEAEQSFAVRARQLVPELDLQRLSQRLPSPQRQQDNARLLQELAQRGLLLQHLQGLGLKEDTARQINSDYLAPFTPLTLNDSNAATVAPPLAGSGNFLGCDSSGCASYMLFSGTADTKAFDALLAADPAIQLLDQVGAINHLLQRYRHWVAGLLAAGGGAATLLLMATIGWRRGLQIASLPLIACVGTLGLVGYLWGAYSIVDLLALLLIIGVGLDYAVFRALTPAAEQGGTSLAITLSALTSVLAFGVLAFSATPIISDFGRTIAIGLGLAYALSWLLPLQDSPAPARPL